MKTMNLFLVFVLIFISCEKNEFDENEPINPYDYVGKQHNTALKLLNEDGKLSAHNLYASPI